MNTEENKLSGPNFDLTGKRIAILVADGFEQDELFKPREALEAVGAETEVVSPCEGKVKGRRHDRPGRSVKAEVPLDQATVEDYAGLLLPGGVQNPDTLRMNEQAVNFVKAFFEAGKPVAAICHGPWLLVEADVVRGRRVTSYQSIKTDLRNAGADWVDEEVVVDHGLVTSRQPDDLPAFNVKMIEEFAEGRHEGQVTPQLATSAPVE
jgi:protease I